MYVKILSLLMIVKIKVEVKNPFHYDFRDSQFTKGVVFGKTKG